MKVLFTLLLFVYRMHVSRTTSASHAHTLPAEMRSPWPSVTSEHEGVLQQEPPPPKVNYRSMGRGTGGVALMRGGLSLADRAAMREERAARSVVMLSASRSSYPFRFRCCSVRHTNLDSCMHACAIRRAPDSNCEFGSQSSFPGSG